jgi:SAM-dependent methyltransferase
MTATPDAVVETLEREEEFHDRWAESVDPATVLVAESFALPSCPENRFIAETLGDVRGLTVLELGAGLGEASVWFATQGAHVIATDLSGGMLRLVRRVAALHGTTVATAQMDGAKLSLPDASVDIVYGANVLHHVDTAACLREVHRVLKPGGRGAFWDPVQYNPVINVYRRMAGQVRSVDEHPLGTADLRTMQSLFRGVTTRFFWLATLAVFLKFYFVDQIHPNEERYWKKVINDYDSVRSWYEPLAALDRLLLRIPGVRWLSWNLAVVLTK